MALVAASKRHPVATLREALACGVTDFGENYVQELATKRAELLAEPATGPTGELALPRWHFIGHLQRNKIKHLLPGVTLVHTIDSDRLAKALDTQLPTRDPAAAARGLEVLIEVNIAEETTKSGVLPAQARALAEAIGQTDHLRLRGLMAIPPATNADRWLAAVAVLRDRLQDELGHALPELSMGMSGDLELAIRHGATRVRIGTAIFGLRP